MESFNLTKSVQIVNASANVDVLYGTYNSLAEACIGVPEILREKSRTVGIIENGSSVEYWWKSGVLNEDLVVKQSQGVKLIEVTKSELDLLITNALLEVGSVYKITEVHTALYGGTTIFLQALTTTQLSVEGNGLFYNPKYTTDAGFGIWSNRGTWVATSVSGVFQANEEITADNGAIGKLFATLDANLFISDGGDWNAAISITGNSSGATATITSVAEKSYAIDDVVFWGGYAWKNLMGFVGASVNSLVMDFEWKKILYDSANYTEVVDVISYNYESDTITSRKDNLGNVVSNGSINVFQWGNPNVYANVSENSNCDIVNFSGSYFYNNTFSGGGFYNNTFSGSYFSYNTFSGGDFSYNTFSGGGFSYNTFSGSDFSTNTFSGSYFYNNTFSGGGFYNNTFSGGGFSYNTFSGGGFYNNTFSGGGFSYNTFSGGDFYDNTFSGGNFYNNTFSGGNFYNNTFSGGDFSYNTFSGGGFSSNTFEYRTIQHLSLESAWVTADFSLATIIFASYPRTIYSRPDGTPRIRYYNDNDELIISVITI